jgi:hypothetical protein
VGEHLRLFIHVGFFRFRWQRQVSRNRKDAGGQLRSDHGERPIRNGVVFATIEAVITYEFAIETSLPIQPTTNYPHHLLIVEDHDEPGDSYP